jgi:hypothetical protein
MCKHSGNLFVTISASARGICTRKCEQILCPGTFILFFFLLICYFCILMYNIPMRIFTDLYLKSKRQIFGYLYTNQFFFFFHMKLQNFESFVRVRLYYLYLPMDVCTIFLHIFNKKIWLQFICNKLIYMPLIVFFY